MLDDKIRDACHRVEELYYDTGGKCYVSFSGGKDSTVLLALIKLCEEVYTIPPNAIPAVFSNTGIELGITYDFVKRVKESYYPNVEIIYPIKPFGYVMENEGKPVRSKIKSEVMHAYQHSRTEASILNLFYGKTLNGTTMRKTRMADRDMHMLHEDFDILASNKCCSFMKKKPFRHYEKQNGLKGAYVGIRMAEGGARESRAAIRVKEGGKLCTYEKNGVTFKAPIIDWSDSEVDEFIEKYNVPLSDAYTKFGFKRTGCMACPFALDVDNSLRYLFFNEPNRYKASMYWLKDVYIAQNVVLPFDEDYERERKREWMLRYEPMRQEMLRKYRPNSRLLKDGDQTTIFDYLEEEK